MNNLSPISASPIAPPAIGAPKPLPSGESGFKDVLLSSIDKVNTMQQDSDQLVETLLTGGDVQPAEVLTAVQKAALTFRLMMQVRNKVMQAFEEVRNIRI